MMMDKEISHWFFPAENKFQSPNGSYYFEKLNETLLGNSLKW